MFANFEPIVSTDMSQMTFASVLQSLLEGQIEGGRLLLTENLTFGQDQVDFLGVNNDIYSTTPELIRKRGYPCETHEVTTKDGYILSLHRIPHGNPDTVTPNVKKPVVLLQQGLLSSSAVWVMGSTDKALGFRLADLGYDVWLLNSRGTTYSKGHTSLCPESKEYWNFSFHEMAEFDLPANFDFVLNQTGQSDLVYIGHSQGTTIFFAGLTLHPEYNSKVRLMVALAPVAFLGRIVSPIGKLAPFINQFDWLSSYLGVNQMLSNSPIMNFFGATACHKLSPVQGILPKILFLLGGDGNEQLDKELLPVILGHVPAGISTKNVIHFGQAVNSGEFRQYNYGKEMNEVNYGRPTPPKYDLTKVTAPVALYYGLNDWLSTKPDVERLAKILPTVRVNYEVPFEKFNHMDFLWAKNVDTLLYEKVEMDIAEVLGQQKGQGSCS